MSLAGLLWKELYGLRRQAALFVVLVLVLPGFIVAGTVVFEQTVPRDVPVGVVAADGASDDDVSVAEAALVSYTDPRGYDSADAAEAGLEREEVYLVVFVPANLSDPDADASFTLVTDRTFVPFEEPVNETSEVLESQFDAAYPATVTVEHERVGTERSLGSFLVPTGLLAFVALYGLVFVPYQLHAERRAIERVRTTTSLEQVVAAKLTFFGALLVIPAAVVALGVRWLGYDVAVFSPLAVAGVGLTFVMLAATGLSVLFFVRLDRSGLFVSVGLALGALSLSSLLFPVGFFSSTQTVVARALPTHYAMITIRSGSLRETPVSLYADYLTALLAATVVSLVVLGLAIRTYERRC